MTMLKRLTVFLYGAVCYVVFLATFVYTVGFVGNVWVRRSIDAPRNGNVVTGLAVNLALLLAFAIQHSVMARPGFKRWMTRFIPGPAERSTYVLASSVALIALFVFWRPLGGTVWSVTEPALAELTYGLYIGGWLLILIATFLINHFDLFGLRQAWLNLISKPYRPLAFKAPGPYRLVRHPLYVGWITVFWATPIMTASHLLFAAVATLYILVAIRFEERDLIATLGSDYRKYRRRVPMLVPFTRARSVSRDSRVYFYRNVSFRDQE
jgi:protein-S-isoprenylcysteine O-methyltransferase Ste14